jgi:hypothetical protein
MMTEFGDDPSHGTVTGDVVVAKKPTVLAASIRHDVENVTVKAHIRGMRK